MPPFVPILIAAAAAGAILLIVLGPGRQLAGRPGPGPAHPARARCRPRTSRSSSSSSRSSSGRCGRSASRAVRLGCRGSRARSFQERTEKRLALAGNPGDLRVADWLGRQGRRRRRRRARSSSCCSASSASWSCRRSCGSLMRRHRPVLRLHDPGVLARRPGQEAPAPDPAPDPGRARPADDLRPGRPRLRRRARQGRREARRAARPTSSAGRWPRSASARRAARRCATSSRGPRSRR